MSDDEIIEEADIQDQVDALEEALEAKSEKLNEIDNLITDLEMERDYKQGEVEDIDDEISDLTTERELSTDQEEMNTLKDEIYELNIQKYDQSKEVSQYNERLEELQSEFDELEEIVDAGIDSAKIDLVGEYKDDVRESLQQAIKDNIEHEGIEFFVSNLGYSLKEAVDYYGEIDRASAISDMEQDRGGIMSSYETNEKIN